MEGGVRWGVRAVEGVRGRLTCVKLGGRLERYANEAVMHIYVRQQDLDLLTVVDEYEHPVQNHRDCHCFSLDSGVRSNKLNGLCGLYPSRKYRKRGPVIRVARLRRVQKLHLPASQPTPPRPPPPQP